MAILLERALSVRLPLALGAALVAAGAVLLFAGFTRLFAALYAPGEVFFLVGCAAGGAAPGAILAYRAGWLPRRRPFLILLGAALAGGLAVLTAIAVAGLASLNLTLLDVLLAFGAFAGVGMAVATVYAAWPERAGILAALQLSLAGLATALCVPLFDALSPL